METLLIEWQRPPEPGGLVPPVAASIRMVVGTAEEASRVWDVLAKVLRLLTDNRPAAGNGR